ncbi:MAG: hypothetical protein WBX15_05820 [Thermoanaerobaculia bacterium]
MKRHRFTRVFLIFSLVSATMVAAAFAGDNQNESIAHMRVSPTQVEWQPTGNNDGVVLTVSGPEGVFSKDFPSGSNPVFQLPDGNADGTYFYELTAVPRIPPGVKQALANAHAKGDEAEAHRLAVLYGLTEPRMQSGAFSVLGGTILSPDVQEPGASGNKSSSGLRGPGAGNAGAGAGTSASELTALDQVIADDLIVQGSECVGFDCVNNESFGFDTLRLKENNTRIGFSDTSTSAGFPSNDWQLSANDSASGGANKFTIEDITGGKTPFTTTAGAPTGSLFIDSSGRIGFGTTTPVLQLHENRTDTPALRLEQNSGGGFTAQTWDIAGNEANFFIRDATNGSHLPFRIRPGAPTSSIDIAASGNVGIGTASPTEKVNIIGTDSPRLLIQDTVDNANDKPGLVLRSPASAGGGDWRFETDNAGNFQIDYTPSAGPELVISDSTTGNGTVTINGNLILNGVCTGCDKVFQSNFPLESIADHASFMWKNSYLPGVGPTPEGKGHFNVFQKTTGMLQELEKAHIYIAQLYEEKEKLETNQNELRDEVNQLRTLVQQLIAAQKN